MTGSRTASSSVISSMSASEGSVGATLFIVVAILTVFGVAAFQRRRG